MGSHRGRRSRGAYVRRVVARIVSKGSHRDRRLSESVNVLGPGLILRGLTEELPKFGVGELVPHVDMFAVGEVIADGRGEGSQQRRVF